MDRAAASDEVRTYMTMLLIAAPILVDAKVPRTFSEQAQKLGAQLVQTLIPVTNRHPQGAIERRARRNAAPSQSRSSPADRAAYRRGAHRCGGRGYRVGRRANAAAVMRVVPGEPGEEG